MKAANFKWMQCALMLAMAISSSCTDPVHDDDVSSLGPEAPNVSPGPTHRPDQPCLVCHGGQGPAQAQFSVAGTVFRSLDNQKAIAGVVVTLTDAVGATHQETTNEVGNFFVHSDQFVPTYPMHVALSYGTLNQKMSTHVGREGSCQGCHHDVAGTLSPGYPYLALQDSDIPASP